MKSKLCNVKKPLPINVATYSPFRVAPFPFWHECTIEYISFQSSLLWPESKITQHVQTLSDTSSFHKCLSFCLRGGCTPPLGRPPTPRWPLQRTVRILLECILVNHYGLFMDYFYCPIRMPIPFAKQNGLLYNAELFPLHPFCTQTHVPISILIEVSSCVK